MQGENEPTFRGVRGLSSKTRKTTENVGEKQCKMEVKSPQNCLKIQENAIFFGFQKEEKRGNKLKRGTLTSLYITI